MGRQRLAFAGIHDIKEVAVMHVLWAVVGGVITFTAGQVLIRVVLEPFLEMKRLIARVAHDLDFYANKLFDNPEAQLARDAFRKDATEIREKYHLVVWYWLFKALRQIPPRQDVLRAAQFLTGQSNFPAKVEQPIWWHDSGAENKKLLRIKT